MFCTVILCLKTLLNVLLLKVSLFIIYTHKINFSQKYDLFKKPIVTIRGICKSERIYVMSNSLTNLYPRQTGSSCFERLLIKLISLRFCSQYGFNLLFFIMVFSIVISTFKLHDFWKQKNTRFINTKTNFINNISRVQYLTV